MKNIKQQWADKLIGTGKQICYFDPHSVMVRTENGYEWPFDFQYGDIVSISMPTKLIGEIKAPYQFLAEEMNGPEKERFTLSVNNARFDYCASFGDVHCMEIGDIVFISLDIDKELQVAKARHEELKPIINEVAKTLAFDIERDKRDVYQWDPKATTISTYRGITNIENVQIGDYVGLSGDIINRPVVHNQADGYAAPDMRNYNEEGFYVSDILPINGEDFVIIADNGSIHTSFNMDQELLQALSDVRTGIARMYNPAPFLAEELAAYPGNIGVVMDNIVLRDPATNAIIDPHTVPLNCGISMIVEGYQIGAIGSSGEMEVPLRTEIEISNIEFQDDKIAITARNGDVYSTFDFSQEYSKSVERMLDDKGIKYTIPTQEF